MSSAAMVRDSSRNRLSTIEAGLDDLARAAARGAGVEVGITWGTIRAIPNRGDAVTVVCHGSGGGYCWEETWSRRRLASFLEGAIPDDPLVRRAAPREVWER